MTVAVVINTAWNIYNFRRGIITSFIEQGHRVLAIAPKDEYVAHLEQLGCEFVPLPMQVSGINPLADFLLLIRFLNIVRKKKPEVLLTYTIKPNIYGSIVARLTNTPIICNISGLGTTFIARSLVSKIAIGLYRISVRHASHVFFQNDEDQRLFLDHVPLKGTTSLLNGSGVNLEQFQPVGVENPHPIFLMIGRPMVEKGVYEYVEAAQLVRERYPEAIFQLIGRWDKGDKRSATEQEMSAWQRNKVIHYLGTSDAIDHVIAKADAIVLPSYREGTPRTLLEGGAMGKPLIATDVPGCRHVVVDGFNGFLCQAKSATSLAQAIIKYIQLPQEEKVSMGQKSRKHIEEKFDEQLVIAEYHRVVNQNGAEHATT